MMKMHAILRLAGRAAATLPQADYADPGCHLAGATPGCFAIRGLDDEKYHRQSSGISSTGLKKLLRSPAHYRAYAEALGDKAQSDTAARRFGRAAHAWLLEPDQFDSKFAVWSAGARRGKAYDEFEAQHAGRTILTKEEMLQVQGCVQALLANDDFPLQSFLHGVPGEGGALLEDPALAEFSIFWTDAETGVACKVRLDAVRLRSPMLAFDLKTTDDAREPAFMRQLMQLDYDLQAAFYVEGLERYTGAGCAFVFGVAEVNAPHASAFYVVGADSELMINGRRKMRHALALKASCDASGCYPGYRAGSVRELQLLPWMVFEPGRP
jgi:hypothetical protein